MPKQHFDTPVPKNKFRRLLESSDASSTKASRQYSPVKLYRLPIESLEVTGIGISHKIPKPLFTKQIKKEQNHKHRLKIWRANHFYLMQNKRKVPEVLIDPRYDRQELKMLARETN